MIVFVHGVPETAAIWDGVRERIGRDSVALSLPGFGNPRPVGFGATKDDYVNGLLGELDGIDGPIDLVGHDWGAGLTLRVATAHGDRLRSWAADVDFWNQGSYDYQERLGGLGPLWPWLGLPLLVPERAEPRGSHGQCLLV